MVSVAVLALLLLPPARAAARPISAVRAKGPPAPVQLHYRIRGEQGQLVPAKLTVLPVGRARRPRLGPRTGLTRGLDVAAHHRVFSLAGQGSVAVPPGVYDVVVSRGLEWDTVRTRVDLREGDARIEATLRRVVDTAGWIATDLHVHAERSTDSVIPMASRVAQLISEGIELIVSTDHNTISDYAPTISELGVRHLITSARGSEITTKNWGHLGAFPLPADVVWNRRTVLTGAHTGAGFIAAVRRVSPSSIIILNHPHSRTSSYLRDGEWDPRTDRARPGFSWDFDAIEIVNGYHRFNLRSAIDRNLRTWFKLLDHGHLIAAVGASDTHQLRAISGQGGYARTYVLVGDDRPTAVSPGDVVQAIKAKRALISTGPFVRATIAGRGLGELAPAPGGQAFLEIEVQAAPWVPTTSITVYVGGKVASRIPIPARRDTLRIVVREPITAARDTYVVVRVDGRGTMKPVVGEHDHEMPSLAITNPIFLDTDGNGRYDPR
jgi:hypothetical protein